MEKLTRSDILPNADYIEIRDDFRSKIIGIKKFRRVGVGPRITMVFENRDTMRFQIQEMIRAEGNDSEEAIALELETYNSLLPG